ncbi:hypothetical protein AcW1_009986 [Taiwanofungus camphoratus]|nr:hypothetical protein AcW1_009986 [Antrodia cinnamomea]
MFSRALVVSSLALLTVANPVNNLGETTWTTTVTALAPAESAAGQCNAENYQCCQQAVAANSTAATTLLGLLGIVLSDLNVLVGIDCLPITVLGTGGACAAETLCCNDTSVGNLISIGCLPIIL